MRKKSLITLVVTVLLLSAVMAGSFGLITKYINLGLDLQGGVHVVLQAKATKETAVTQDAIARTIEVLHRRVNETGVREPVIQPEGRDRIIVELAGLKDPEEAIRLIGKTAVLRFKTADGKTVLTGEDLKTAQTGIDPYTNQPEISLTFTSEGARKFAEITTKNVGKPIAIYLDEQLLTNPVVKEPITNGQARITGNRTVEEAENIAKLLRAGALPLDLEFVEKRVVGPTLGADSLNKSILAGEIGLVAILVFMILFYRLPGLVADFALVVYAFLVLGLLAALNATLTLPGIAGFLLSLGMAVDTNIIIYERIKEELRAGKTVRTAIEAGFNRAFTTVLDANVTTLIAAAVLYFLGTASIRGFAVTLALGIVASMFTAISFTRWMLRLIADAGVKNSKLFGA
ncbi:protein translocase subunit SecD [Carboxydocella sp. ULO1]|uniref:protein translocase subunit SecD n=1 Tax=Carboxydocella sp. ULO1 TaxID=1926599 RepID=UPI0009AC08A5|nr:protein translocase subunit SecD [Carboxydocella sp. ULO1]AVX31951.1 preprotein translocase subunit SecD [Carboxydocella thermautotrophica]GAW29209.1 protein-export membrane protein SecD [Carboxydocella sp. ULO1]